MSSYKVPTMGASLFLTDPGEIIFYQIRHYLAVSRQASDVYYQNTRSYMDAYSRFGHNRDLFRSQVDNDMNFIMKRVFYNDANNVNVDITTTDVVGSPNTYNIVFSITITVDNKFYAVSPEVYMVNGVPMMRNDTVTAIPLTASTITS